MDNSNKSKNLIIGLVAIIFLGLILFYVSGFSGSEPSGGLVAGTQVGGPGNIQSFLRQISAINSVSLDASVFQHNVLMQLSDQSIPIFDEFKGRRNPFAPFRETTTVEVKTNPTNIEQPTTLESDEEDVVKKILTD